MAKRLPRQSSIQVLDRAMSLLDALTHTDQPLSLKTLSLTTQLNRSTACRILDALQRHGYVEKAGTGFYRLPEIKTNPLNMRSIPEMAEDLTAITSVNDKLEQSIALPECVDSCIHSPEPIIEVLAMDTLVRVRDAINETVSLARFDNGDVIFTRCVGSQRVPVTEISEGMRLPLHLTACGKLWLGEQGIEITLEYNVQRGKFAASTLNFIEEENILHESRRAFKRGYGNESEETQPGIASIATLIYDRSGPIAGLSIHAPIARLDQRWAAVLKAHTLLLTQQLCLQQAA
ncbi:MAG: helix-turn-helix domain-containing protein [Gammaproteobacteria bacterium]|nr:helix-turn-helix domain-containing protein [Gammaproteobacteria bacterium]